MNILFVGSIYSDSFKNILKKNGLPVSSAGQTFETALISGLDTCSNVRVISEFFVPCFPRFRRFWIKRELFSHNVGGVDIGIGYLNLPVVKKISQFISFTYNILKSKGKADTIIVYEVTSRQLLSSVIGGRGKRKIVIVPDLPEFMSDNKNPVYLFAKKIDRLIIDFALKRMDGFVLLSPYMRDKLLVGNKPCMVLEGLYNTKELVERQQKSEKKVIMYSGKLEKWFGVEDLLQAFTRINGDDYQLWLCGPGDIEMINKYASKDSRILYKGCLTHLEVLKMQQQATILVNPRHSSDEFTMYSFPSKTMEYMASGTPTLMCKLKSLPDDYIDHLLLFEDESVEGMSHMMEHCLNINQTELNSIGNSASKFIFENKNAIAQANRLENFIREIL